MSFWRKLGVFFTVLFIRIAFATGLRKAWLAFSCWVFQPRGKADLPKLDSPKDVEDLLGKCQYKADPLKGKWDFIYDPRYLIYKINNHDYENFPKGPWIGDCDDFHWLGAHLLALVDCVTDVTYLSSAFYSKEKKKTGAHATCVYKYEGAWHHLDYRIRDIKNDPNNAPDMVAVRYTGGDKEAIALYWVWEDLKHNLVALYPDKLSV